MSHQRRLFAVGVLAVALFVIGFGSAGSVSAAIDPVAFQKLGCNNGDLTCYYARLYGGYPLRAPFCDSTGCTVPDVGDGFIGAPFFGTPYFVNPSFAGYPYVAVNPVNVYPGNVVVVAPPTFNGGIITPLNP